MSSGCPPSGLTDFTWPFAATMTSSFTAPVTFIFFASSGYRGLTLDLIFRPASSPWLSKVNANTQLTRIARKRDLRTRLDTVVSLDRNSSGEVQGGCQQEQKVTIVIGCCQVSDS